MGRAGFTRLTPNGPNMQRLLSSVADMSWRHSLGGNTPSGAIDATSVALGSAEPNQGSWMRRREFITGLVATAGWPFDVRAQQAPLRAGFLPLGSPDNAYDRSLVELFRQGLRDVGVVEDRDIVLDTVWTSDEAEIPRVLTELMERGAGLLIPCGANASVAAKRRAPGNSYPMTASNQATFHRPSRSTLKRVPPTDSRVRSRLSF